MGNTWLKFKARASRFFLDGNEVSASSRCPH